MPNPSTSITVQSAPVQPSKLQHTIQVLVVLPISFQAQTQLHMKNENSKYRFAIFHISPHFQVVYMSYSLLYSFSLCVDALSSHSHLPQFHCYPYLCILLRQCILICSTSYTYPGTLHLHHQLVSTSTAVPFICFWLQPCGIYGMHSHIRTLYYSSTHHICAVAYVFLLLSFTTAGGLFLAAHSKLKALLPDFL